MVRLEDLGDVQLVEQRGSFNSKMVRLEGSLTLKTKTGKTGFNSKMVRLEDMKRYFVAISSLKFQFQNGAIRSRSN